ncbi:DUF6286 domain-containing Asp23/Gls24 family envelope stress response protein [Streptomyces sp. NPDC012421]|uniref:DUF6286 domain-containing Asp23/Gls24 family envelope stress response protein n=1 Tax=Streptomyces sp. NPDC012421 TaxID=3364832 RepID=UPI0036F06308
MSGSRRGVTTVADRAVARIARQAAVEATTRLGGEVLRSTASRTGRAGRTGRSDAVTVEVGLPISALAEAGRESPLQLHVASRTRYLTGLDALSAHVRIRELTAAPPAARPQAAERPAARSPVAEQAARLAARGTWSRWRLVTTWLAVATTGMGTVLLWAALDRHVPGLTAPFPWHVAQAAWGSAGRSAVHHGAVIAGALLGGWLLLLAVTPGRRRTLTLGCVPPTRARITRRGAARLLRAALSGVAGLRVRGVHCGPRRVTVRAQTVFGEPEDVRGTALEVIGATVGRMSLGRTPSVRLVLKDARNPYAAMRQEGS